MKRYLLFIGETYHPVKWHDYRGSFDDLDTLKAYVLAFPALDIKDWAQVVDRDTERVVLNADIYVDGDTMKVEWTNV